MRNHFLFIPFAYLAIVSQAVSQVLQPIGLAIINDGSTVETASTAVEYSAIRFAAGTYQITLPNGQKFSNLAGHLKKRIDYREKPSQQVLLLMENTSTAYSKAQPFLAPRIAGMRKQLEQLKFQAENEGGTSVPKTEILAPKMEYKGKTFTNIRATRLQAGKIGFSHDSGSFSVPAVVLSEDLLEAIKKRSPDLARKSDFLKLLGTFVNGIVINGKAHTGVRVLKQEGDTLILETNSGLRKIKSSLIEASAMKKLDAGLLRMVELQRQFNAAQKEETKREAEHMARAEIAQLRQAEIEKNLLADAEAAQKRESEIREQAMKRVEDSERNRMVVAGLMLTALAWAVLSDGGGGNTVDEGYWSEESSRIRNIERSNQEIEDRAKQAKEDDWQRYQENKQKD